MSLQKLQPATTKTLFTALLALLLLLTFVHNSDLKALILPHAVHQRGAISPILHSQNLSHGSFHNPFTKPYLLDLATTEPHPSAVVVGLARGGEALMFGKTHQVHAVEPLQNYVKLFRERDVSTTKNITLYPLAASDHNHDMKIRYRGVTETVQARRLEEVLPGGLRPAVVSVDVQGGEFAALLGMAHVLDSTNSVWVEVGCPKHEEEHPLQLLKFLNERFLLFDFVPWGKRRDVDDMWDARQFVWGGRPNDIDDWVRWFCGNREEFQWLQTDVVGIRRELLAARPEILKGLMNVAKENCAEGCFFREHALRAR